MFHRFAVNVNGPFIGDNRKWLILTLIIWKPLKILCFSSVYDLFNVYNLIYNFRTLNNLSWLMVNWLSLLHQNLSNFLENIRFLNSPLPNIPFPYLYTTTPYVNKVYKFSILFFLIIKIYCRLILVHLLFWYNFLLFFSFSGFYFFF